MLAGFITFMIAIAVPEALILVRRRQWRELAAFAVVWVLAAVYGALVVADVPVPSPVRLIILFFEGLTAR